MNYRPPPEVPKWALTLLNNLYEAERKIEQKGDSAHIKRNLERMKDALSSEGLFYEDPVGQSFNETRTDLEASIVGENTENLIVTEVMKPIIRHGEAAYSRVVQKGIVLVQSKLGDKADD